MSTTAEMKEEFIGVTLAEANRKADDWLMKQKGLRLIQRTQVGAGFGPSLTTVDRWVVTIHYETERTNDEI